MEIPPRAKYNVCNRAIELREFLKNVLEYKYTSISFAIKKDAISATAFHAPAEYPFSEKHIMKNREYPHSPKMAKYAADKSHSKVKFLCPETYPSNFSDNLPLPRANNDRRMPPIIKAVKINNVYKSPNTKSVLRSIPSTANLWAAFVAVVSVAISETASAASCTIKLFNMDIVLSCIGYIDLQAKLVNTVICWGSRGKGFNGYGHVIGIT